MLLTNNIFPVDLYIKYIEPTKLILCNFTVNVTHVLFHKYRTIKLKFKLVWKILLRIKLGGFKIALKISSMPLDIILDEFKAREGQFENRNTLEDTNLYV